MPKKNWGISQPCLMTLKKKTCRIYCCNKFPSKYPFYYPRNSVSIINIPLTIEYSPKKNHHVCWINNCFWWLNIVKSSSKHSRNTLTRQPPLLLREHSSPPPVSHCEWSTVVNGWWDHRNSIGYWWLIHVNTILRPQGFNGIWMINRC